jgi:carbamoyl-phosphate synthase large subunit
MLGAARTLAGMGFGLLATKGTAAWLHAAGIEAQAVNKVYEGGLTVVDRMKDGHVALVLNTTEGTQAVSDSREIRRVALMDRIPYYTTAAGAQAVAEAMRARGEGEVGVRSLQA